MILAQWVVNVGRRDARSRVAHLLCEMAWRYKVPPAPAKMLFELPMTQSQLADAVGLTAVHVNRTLKALASVGIRFSQMTVQIDDWDALVEIGDFDPTYLQDDQRPEERLRIVQ